MVVSVRSVCVSKGRGLTFWIERDLSDFWSKFGNNLVFLSVEAFLFLSAATAAVD